MLQILCPVGKGAYLLEAEMVLIRSCGTNHLLLYYFVLTFEESCIGSVMFPTLSMWKGPKSDVWFFSFLVWFCFTSFCSFFILILSRIFFSLRFVLFRL